MATTKSPTLAERKAQPHAHAFSASQSLSDVVRAAAGHTEAKRDVMAGAVYSAYFQALKHGNKSQLQGRASSLFEQATMYSSTAKAKAGGFPQPKKAGEYYAAHLSALNIVGMPGKATPEQVAEAALAYTNEGGWLTGADIVVAMAEGMALAYIDAVDNYLAELVAEAAEKRAASKAAQAKAAPVVTSGDTAEGDGSAAAVGVQASIVPAPAMTLADMVAAVAAALRTGTIDEAAAGVLAEAADEYNALIDVRETAALLAGMAVGSVASVAAH